MRILARWCIDHWQEYGRAPDRDIEQIYLRAIREEAVSKTDAELIEQVLNSISDEYEREDQFNSAYLFDCTVKFFREREVTQHAELVQGLIDRGRPEEAAALAADFHPRSWVTSRGLDLGTEPGYERVRAVFERVSAPILTYPGALGGMLNEHLIRDGFVAFLAPEKRGKTWFLTDVALRALRQRCNVSFFQAGDLSEGQMLRRIAISMSRRSDDPRYSAAHFRPVGDCVKNQFDRCTRADRNCDFGVYEPSEFDAFREDETAFQNLARLADAYRASPGYAPCDSAGCVERWPCAWLEEVEARVPLTGDLAERTVRAFFERYRRRFRLATYPSGTLDCGEIRSCLDEWEAQDDFVPDVIAVDYADIMSDPTREFRHRQNEIWMGLRAISQERHALVVTATQADADSYRSSLLGMGNFSEDKRKLSHVTAMWGLNQDHLGREKDLGIMRVNTILAREGASNPVAVVHVLQDLAAGRPFTESYASVGSHRFLASPVDLDG